MNNTHMTQVTYLEDSDVNADGSLKSYVTKGKPTVVMIQGVFCGYCTKAKPAFKEFSQKYPNISAVTVQTDGQPSEKKAGELITKLDPNHRGVPAYFGFDKNGKFVKVHSGGRDAQSLQAFANSL
jgi:thiol-disulfide isomerase/thioredoxin